MDGFIKGIAAVWTLAHFGVGVFAVINGGPWGGVFVTWLYGFGGGLLLYAFAYMLELVEENNRYIRELYDRIQRMEQVVSGEEKPRSMGNSRASLDKLKDYKMK